MLFTPSKLMVNSDYIFYKNGGQGQDKACNISLSSRILEGWNIFLENLFTTKLGGRTSFWTILFMSHHPSPEESLSSWEFKGTLPIAPSPVR